MFIHFSRTKQQPKQLELLQNRLVFLESGKIIKQYISSDADDQADKAYEEYLESQLRYQDYQDY